MDCSCDISHDVLYDSVQFSRETQHKARKKHICGECLRTIQVGERYEKYVTFCEDGIFHTHKLCLDCMSAKNRFFSSGFYYEQVWEHIREFVFDVKGSVPEKCLADLTPTAREKVCGFIEEAWERWGN